MTKISIDGLKGLLLKDNDGFTFRIPFKNEDGFIDLDIFHNDLEVTLHGEGKAVILPNGEGYIDHSDEVLGD